MLFHRCLLQSGQRLELDWERGRVFDQDVGGLFLSIVKDCKTIRVVSVSSKEDRKGRPHGLNTVELLKVASTSLGIGPHHTMQVSVKQVLMKPKPSTLCSMSVTG